MIKKVVLITSIFISLLTLKVCAGIKPACALYPHWNCKNSEEYTILQRLETFINNHSVDGKGVGIVAFDWDGTLYDEHLPNPDQANDARSGQSLWHIWGANHLNQYPYLFPAFKADSVAQQAEDIKMHDSYLEDKTFQPINSKESEPLVPGGYDKFSQIATFENGMSLAQMKHGLEGYLNDFSPRDYAFTKILDVLQRMQNKGFVVWIISGSNPYFIANVLHSNNGVNAILGYNLFPTCVNTTSDPQNFIQHCPVAGNGSKIAMDNDVYHFTGVYDDRFLKNALSTQDRAIVDRYGKQIFLKQLSQKLNLPVVFYAGNSEGDAFAVNYTLNNSSDSMVLFVQPQMSKSPTLLQLLKTPLCDERCIEIENPR